MTTTSVTEHSTTTSVGTPTARVTGLPTYVFAWLDELKADARARGIDLIDLGIGNPDQPTPPSIVDVIRQAYQDPSTHGYPPFRGIPAFLEAAARYMKRRFGVDVDPEREVLCLSGAKEGIAHATMAFTDETTTTLVPDIYYPVHARATGLTGGRTSFLPLRAERGFLPDLDDVPDDGHGRLLILNYPHNPTGAVAPLSLYERAVALCRERGTIYLSDLAYSELTFDGERAPSALQVPGAREVTLEFHSFSKSFNMAGSRLGFAVGGADVIDALLSVRTNMGYGTPAAVQRGGVFALDNAETLTAGVADRYRRRRDHLLRGLRELGWTGPAPRGSMFVWLPVPRGVSSQEWTRRLIDRAGVVVTPGNAFGPGGEGYFRISLVADLPVLDRVIERLRQAGVGA